MRAYVSTLVALRCRWLRWGVFWNFFGGEGGKICIVSRCGAERRCQSLRLNLVPY